MSVNDIFLTGTVMEKRNISRSVVLSGLLWRWLERVGAQGVQFIVSLVLARLLAPEVFGTVALINVIIAILEVFVDSGLGNSLIQKKEADDLDFSTVFYFNIFVCCVLYVCLFFAAPFIAGFYNLPELISPIRVIGIILVISGVKNVQQAYISRTMQFKLFFYATLCGTIGAAVLGIWMAAEGFGIWALIAQSLFNMTVDTVILWVTVKWRPKRMFSWERLKILLTYGWKLLVSSLLNTGYNRLRQMVIGKLYTPTNLAFYDKGSTFPAIVVTNINASMNSVLFPAMSSEQDNKEKIKSLTRRAIKTSSYIMWPMMLGLCACAESIVKVLLTAKWLPCVPYLRIFCITYAFYPIHTANLNAIMAMGRSDIFLKLEIIKKTIGFGLLVITMHHGVMAIAYSLLISCFTSQIINSWPNRKLLNYRYEEQIKDIIPSIALSALMFVIVWSIQFLHLNIFFTFIVQVIGGAAIYLGGSLIFKIDSFSYLLTLFGELRKRQ